LVSPFFPYYLWNVDPCCPFGQLATPLLWKAVPKITPVMRAFYVSYFTFSWVDVRIPVGGGEYVNVPGLNAVIPFYFSGIS